MIALTKLTLVRHQREILLKAAIWTRKLPKKVRAKNPSLLALRNSPFSE